MSAKKIITWLAVMLALLVLLAVLLGGLLWYGRSRVQEKPASDASYGLINSPSNGDVVFAGDPVYVDASFMLAHSNPAALALYVDGDKYVLNESARPYSGQEPLKCSSDNPAFCGLLDARALWLPTGPGPHVLSACLSGGQSQGAEWSVCSEAVNVTVADLAAAPQTAGQYLPQAGDTLETVAQKFGLPSLLVSADNPGIEPATALPVDVPINIPADPALVKPAGDESAAGSRIFDKASMTVDQPLDKAYCYASFGGDLWTRMPAGPQRFVFPLDGHLDLSAEFRALAIPPAGGTLALDCWGWSGPTLVYLGRGQTGFGPSNGTTLELRGDHFALTGIFHPGGLPHAMGGTPPATPPATPPPAILPPYGLARTGTLDVCIDHFPPGMRGFLGPLFCKAAIEHSQRILVWEWGAIFPPEGFSDKIDGYKLYKTDSSGKLVLIKTIPDPEQKIFINTATLTPVEAGDPTYCVTAYLGVLESTSSCYKLSGAPVGLATVSLLPSTKLYGGQYKHKENTNPLSSCHKGGLGHFVDSGEAAASEISVGFDHLWPDESAHTCTIYDEEYSRAKVVFDLSTVAGPVSSANLSYRQDFTSHPGQSCARELGVITTGASGVDLKDLAYEPLALLQTYGYTGTLFNENVTSAVRDWVVYGANYGFLYVGRDENLPPDCGGLFESGCIGGSTESCWTAYSDLKLTVTYFVK